MIGKLKGLIDSYGEDYVILDVQGVGYVVHCSARTLQRLPGIGHEPQVEGTDGVWAALTPFCDALPALPQ